MCDAIKPMPDPSHRAMQGGCPSDATATVAGVAPAPGCGPMQGGAATCMQSEVAQAMAAMSAGKENLAVAALAPQGSIPTAAGAAAATAAVPSAGGAATAGGTAVAGAAAGTGAGAGAVSRALGPFAVPGPQAMAAGGLAGDVCVGGAAGDDVASCSEGPWWMQGGEYGITAT